MFRSSARTALVAVPVLAALVAAHAQTALAQTTDDGANIVKVIRGVTECRDARADNAPCGADYWTMTVHKNGYRFFTVASDQRRQGQARQAMVWLDEGHTSREAMMVNLADGKLLGSSYVHLDGDKALVVADNAGFPGGDGAPITETVESFESHNSLGTGPASADGLHFFDYDLAAGGPQPHSVYWFGGSRQNGMVGGFVTSEYEYLGDVDYQMPDGSIMPARHFRMLSGTEVWIDKTDHVLLKMDLKFDTVTGLVYQITSLDVIEPAP